MKFSSLALLALSASVNNVHFVEEHETDQIFLNANGVPNAELFLIELTPGKTQWVTEEEKWEFEEYASFTK
jgi:leucyl aminopeptidase